MNNKKKQLGKLDSLTEIRYRFLAMHNKLRLWRMLLKQEIITWTLWFLKLKAVKQMKISQFHSEILSWEMILPTMMYKLLIFPIYPALKSIMYLN